MDICVTAFAPSGDKLAATDANGRFVFSGMRPGKYHLEYRSCGGAERYLTAWYGRSNARSSSQPALVTGTGAQALATVTLRPGTPGAASGSTRPSPATYQ